MIHSARFLLKFKVKPFPVSGANDAPANNSVPYR